MLKLKGIPHQAFGFVQLLYLLEGAQHVGWVSFKMYGLRD